VHANVYFSAERHQSASVLTKRRTGERRLITSTKTVTRHTERVNMLCVLAP